MQNIPALENFKKQTNHISKHSAPSNSVFQTQEGQINAPAESVSIHNPKKENKVLNFLNKTFRSNSDGHLIITGVYAAFMFVKFKNLFKFKQEQLSKNVDKNELKKILKPKIYKIYGGSTLIAFLLCYLLADYYEKTQDKRIEYAKEKFKELNTTETSLEISTKQLLNLYTVSEFDPNSNKITLFPATYNNIFYKKKITGVLEDEIKNIKQTNQMQTPLHI